MREGTLAVPLEITANQWGNHLICSTLVEQGRVKSIINATLLKSVRWDLYHLIWDENSQVVVAIMDDTHPCDYTVLVGWAYGEPVIQELHYHEFANAENLEFAPAL